MSKYHDHRSDCPFKFAPLDVCDCVEHNMLDRIKALTAENKRLRDAVYIDDLTVTLQGEDRAAAIEGFGRALDLLRADMIDETKASLRATLAKMKGEKT